MRRIITKDRAIAALATVCTMETLQIATGVPWTCIEAVSAGAFLYWMVYYTLLEIEDKWRDRKWT